MVCTNLASRGIDLDSVDHVIMYDFPHTLADYLHRAGRTARAGRLGQVTALYTKRNLELAQKIQDATRLGKPIEYKKAIATRRRIVKLERYKESLDQLKHHPSKKNMSIRGLRAKMGIPPHLGIGSVERRAVAKEWKNEQSKEKEIKFLQKRKRLGKKETLPKLPDRGIEASETRTANAGGRTVRNPETGDLQMIVPPPGRAPGRSGEYKNSPV